MPNPTGEDHAINALLAPRHLAPPLLVVLLPPVDADPLCVLLGVVVLGGSDQLVERVPRRRREGGRGRGRNGRGGDAGEEGEEAGEEGKERREGEDADLEAARRR